MWGVPVYRTLELLHAHESLQRVHRLEGEYGYVVGEPDHQHHLVCRSCNTAHVLEGCELEHLKDGELVMD